jgi:hypothetical protein
MSDIDNDKANAEWLVKIGQSATAPAAPKPVTKKDEE